MAKISPCWWSGIKTKYTKFIERLHVTAKFIWWTVGVSANTLQQHPLLQYLSAILLPIILPNSARPHEIQHSTIVFTITHFFTNSTHYNNTSEQGPSTTRINSTRQNQSSKTLTRRSVAGAGQRRRLVGGGQVGVENANMSGTRFVVSPADPTHVFPRRPAQPPVAREALLGRGWRCCWVMKVVVVILMRATKASRIQGPFRLFKNWLLTAQLRGDVTPVKMTSPVV